MFDFQLALQHWNGDQLSLADLQSRLSALRLEHLVEIPPEIGVRELLMLALDRHWIVEEATGQLRIEVPEVAAA